MTTFIGRAGELSRLRDWAAEVAGTGVGRFVLVTGAAGVGKSALCAELTRRLEPDVAVAWSRCWADAGGPALWPWPDLVAELAARRDVTPPEDGGGDRFHRFHGVVEQLRELCRHGPAVALVDDLHAAGGDVHLLTRFVARSLHRFPLLLVATWRTGDDTDPATVAPDATRLHLGGLEAPDVAALLTVSGRGDAGPETAAELVALTGGNPLYLREILGYGRTPDAAGLAQVLARRVAALEAGPRAVLQAAAVLGEAATVAEVAAVLDVPPAEVLAALADPASGAHLEAGGIRFSHDLLRRAFLDALPAAVRHRLHTTAAAAIVGDDPQHAVRRARHAAGAVPPDAAPEVRADAATACLVAVQSLRAALALEPAASWAARGAALAAGADVGLEAELLLTQAESVLARGRLDEARGVFDRAVAVADRTGDPRLRARAALGLGGVWVEEQRDELSRRRMLALCRRAIADLPADDPLVARLRVRLSAEAAYDGGSADDVRDAVAVVRRHGDPAATAEALSLYHHTLLVPDRARDRLVVADELLDTAAEAPASVYGLFGLCWRTVDLYLLGDRTAERAFVDLREQASALGSASIGYIAAAIDVMRDFRRGDLAAAEAAADDVLKLGTAVGDADAVAYYGAHLLGIRWAQGRLGEMAGAIEAIMDSATLRRQDLVYPAAAGYAAALNGDRTSARATLDRLVADGVDDDPDYSTWTTKLAVLIELAAELDDADLSARLAERFAPYARLPVMPSLAVMCLGPGERMMGVALAAAGRLDDAVHWFGEALAAGARIGSLPFAAIVHGQLAAALRRRGAPGDRAAALEHYGTALSLGRELGLTGRVPGWEAAVAELTGPEPAGPEPAGPEPATPKDPHAVAGLLERRQASWYVEIDGRGVEIEPLVGLRYVAELVRRPDTDLTASRLAAVVAGGGVDDPLTGGEPVLDGRALHNYRRRIAELDRELDAADLTGDAARAARAAQERSAIVDALRRDTGLGGRVRRQPDAAERSRTRVSKAVRRAIARLTEADPVLGHALATGVRTGYVCRYVPDPGHPVAWVVRL